MSDGIKFHVKFADSKFSRSRVSTEATALVSLNLHESLNFHVAALPLFPTRRIRDISIVGNEEVVNARVIFYAIFYFANFFDGGQKLFFGRLNFHVERNPFFTDF